MEQNKQTSHEKFYNKQKRIHTEKQKQLHVEYLDILNMQRDEPEKYESLKTKLRANFMLENQLTIWEYTYESLGTIKNDIDNSDFSKQFLKEFSYIIDKDADVLYGSQINQKIPSIVFKEGYSGCWTNLLGIILLQTLTFSIKDRKEPIQKKNWVSSYFDLIESKDKDIILTDIGEVPELTTISKFLPEYTLVIKPKNLFASEGKFFPIYLTSTQDELYVTIEVINEIEKLLRVFDANGNQVKDFNAKDCIEYINGVSINEISKFRLEKPEMTFYYQRRDSGLNDFQCSDCSVIDTSGHIKVDFENCSYSWSPNPRKLGETDIINVSFLEKEAPYKFEFLTQNYNAKENNDYTNFTTNSINRNKGYNTYKDIQILVDNIPYTENLPIYRLNRLAGNRSVKQINGTGSISNSPNDIEPKSGICGEKFDLCINLEDQNNYLNCFPTNDPRSNDFKPSTDLFKTCLVVRFTDSIVFVKYPKNKEERKTVKCEII